MTKKQSSALYGIAILLMLYHHLLRPDLLNLEYISVLNFGGVNIEQAIAWFGKICVGIYAFISGFGMFCVLQKIKEKDFPLGQRMRIIYSSIGKRIFVFMRKYWLVFCIFVPIGFALGVYKPNGFLYLFENFISYRYDYNGAWWYVQQYVFMIFLLPFIDLFFDFVFIRQCRTCRVFAVLLGQGVFYIATFFALFHFSKVAVYYTLIFVIGYLCSRFNIFSKLKKRIPHGVASYLIGGILLAVTFAVRSVLAKNPGHIGSDILLAPVFAFAVCLLTRVEGKPTQCLAWLGKYSVYMWLTHNFYGMYYFRDFITVTRISTLMYLQLVVVSLLTSAILIFLEKRLCMLCKKIFDGRTSSRSRNEI